jgi:hypothetical protein
MADDDRIDARDAQRRLERAGDIIETEVRSAAAGFSRRIPLATHRDQVGLSDSEVTVTTDHRAAPNAAPFEWAEHHPLFGGATGKPHEGKGWYQQPRRPYAAEGLLAASDRAADEAGNMVDDWAHDLGFKDDD